MKTKTEITIKLSEETASLYYNISEVEQQKIQLKINKFISEELHNRMAFNDKIPNETTILAMNDTKQKIGKTFNSINDLLTDLND